MTDYVAVSVLNRCWSPAPGSCSAAMAFARISLNSNLDSALHSVRVSGGGISAGCLPLDDVPPDYNGEDVVCVVAMEIHHFFQGSECILVAGERLLCDGSGHPLRILQILSAEVVHRPIGRLPGVASRPVLEDTKMQKTTISDLRGSAKARSNAVSRRMRGRSTGRARKTSGGGGQS